MNLQGLLVALSFLTRLPVPLPSEVSADALSSAKAYFPAVGLVIGAVLAAVYWGTGQYGVWIGALAVLTTWIWITGALHLDGLGDVADALGAAHGDPERFHGILKDPHAGNFAVTAIGLQLAAKLVLVAELPGSSLPWILLLVPAWARWGVLAWSAMLPSLRAGLGRALATEHSWAVTVFWAMALAATSTIMAPQLLAALIIVPLIGLYWRWRLGGTTGDCHGASIEVTETLLLLSALVLHV